METQPRTGLTYEDVNVLPEESRELIGGELFVTPSPSLRHQLAAGEIFSRLHNHAKQHGGVALMAPFDVKFSDIDVLQPDVLYVRSENLGRIEEPYIAAAPDLVVEVSSPSTRQLEHLRKRDLYERNGVPEYWLVDLEIERIEIYRLEGDRYGPPSFLGPDDTLTTSLIPGLEVPLEDVLRPRLGRSS